MEERISGFTPTEEGPEDTREDENASSGEEIKQAAGEDTAQTEDAPAEEEAQTEDAPAAENTAQAAPDTVFEKPKKTKKKHPILWAVLISAVVSAAVSLGAVYAFLRLSGGRVYFKQARVVYETKTAYEDLTLPQIYEQALKWTVAITALYPEAGMRSYGTGVVYRSDGYIATNLHVVNDSQQITVTDWQGIDHPAVLVASDANTDLALLKTEAQLDPALWGDSSELAAGNTAVVIGNPLSSQFSGTMTSGIISSPERVITVNNYMMGLIQIDAAVNSGNSGGPLLNSAGAVVGIVNAKMDRDGVEGIGFAIPSNTVIAIMNDLIEYGKVVHRATLGVTVRYYSSEAAAYYQHEQGVFVLNLVEGGAAEKAGILPGDKLVAIDGKPIEDSSSLVYIIQNMQVGQQAEITVERDGQTMTFSAVMTDAGVVSK